MASTEPAVLVHQARPLYDGWLKVMLAALLLVTLVPGLVLLPIREAAAWAMLGTTALDGLLLHAILPRRFLIYSTHLRIVLGWPFVMTIPFRDIVEARPVGGSRAWLYLGLRLATSSHGVIEVTRRHGLDIVFTPEQPEAFLDELNQARRLA
jgi:hypothetical protein